MCYCNLFCKRCIYYEHDQEDSNMFLTCDRINCNCVIAIYSVKMYNMNMIMRNPHDQDSFFLNFSRNKLHLCYCNLFRKSLLYCEHDHEGTKKMFLTCDGMNCNCVIAIYSVKVYNMNMIMRNPHDQDSFFLNFSRNKLHLCYCNLFSKSV